MLVRSVLALVASASLASLAIADANNDAFAKSLPSAYQRWYEERGTVYQNVARIGSDDVRNAAVSWNIVDDEIHVAVAANATGWVSLGIAESGGMPGADVVIYTVKDDALIDAHATAYAAPIVDKCQNWELAHSEVDLEEGYVVFEAVRKLDTGDPQDRAIGDDSDVSTPSNRLIAAWGDDDDHVYHGDKRATSVTRLRRTPASSKSDDDVDLDAHPHVDMIADDFLVPLEETTYEGFCFNLTDFATNFGYPADKDVHMIGARFVGDDDSINHVHHVIVYASKDLDDCGGFNEMVYLWGPGADDNVLPPNAGFLFGPNGYQSFQLSIHYDNQGLVPDVLDSSGVRFFYTETLREHEAGIYQIGDPFLLLGSLSGEGATSPEPGKYGKWEIDCPASCTRKEIPAGQSITVFGEFLHMHEVGSRMVSSQYRGLSKIRESVVDYYDFDLNGAYGMIQAPYEVEPGDSFKVECFYKSKNPGDEVVYFGPASNEEMCISFLWYYPRLENSPQFCSPLIAFFGGVECNAFDTYREVEECGVRRGFGREPASCDSFNCRGGVSKLRSLFNEAMKVFGG